MVKAAPRMVDAGVGGALVVVVVVVPDCLLELCLCCCLVDESSANKSPNCESFGDGTARCDCD